MSNCSKGMKRRPKSRRSSNAKANKGRNRVSGSRRRNTKSTRRNNNNNNNNNGNLRRRKSSKRKGKSNNNSNSKRKGQNGGSPAYRFHQTEGFLSQLSDFPRDLPLFQEGDGTDQGYYQVSV